MKQKCQKINLKESPKEDPIYKIVYMEKNVKKIQELIQDAQYPINGNSTKKEKIEKRKL